MWKMWMKKHGRKSAQGKKSAKREKERAKSDKKAIGKTHSTKKTTTKGKKAIAKFCPRITFFADTFRAFFSNDTRKFMANTWVIRQQKECAVNNARINENERKKIHTHLSEIHEIFTTVNCPTMWKTTGKNSKHLLYGVILILLEFCSFVSILHFPMTMEIGRCINFHAFFCSCSSGYY